MAAVQALFQLEQTDASVSAVVNEFLLHRLREAKPAANTSFFRKLVEGAWAAHDRHDDIITGALKEGWELNRLESVTRAILRAALYELLETETPSAVIINEYLNLGHSFFDETEVSFINGVLNTVAKKVRPGTENSL